MNPSAIEMLYSQIKELETLKLRFNELNNQFIVEILVKTRQTQNTPQNREALINSYTFFLKEYEMLITKLNALIKESMKIQFDAASLN